MCQAQVLPSSLQEIEYLITVGRLLGARSKDLFTHLLEKRLQGCVYVAAASQSWVWLRGVEASAVYHLDDLPGFCEFSAPWFNVQ